MDLIDEAEGRSLTSITVQGLGGWILSMWVSLIAGFQQVFELLFLPFKLMIEIAGEAVNAFILQPFGIVEAGAEITSREIVVFDFLALPVSVIIALGTLLIVVLYLQFNITSNFLPGLFVDNRLIDLFFTSPEEEAEGED